MNIDKLCTDCAYSVCNKEVFPCYSCNKRQLNYVCRKQISKEEQERIDKKIKNNWN